MCAKIPHVRLAINTSSSASAVKTVTNKPVSVLVVTFAKEVSQGVIAAQYARPHPVNVAASVICLQSSANAAKSVKIKPKIVSAVKGAGNPLVSATTWPTINQH